MPTFHSHAVLEEAEAEYSVARQRKWTWYFALALILFSGFYFSDVLTRAAAKYFWYDELFTVYFCRLPNFSSLWNALRSGIDFNPPLFYLVTRASESLFGEGLIATRLPEILGFWVFCLSLFTFVSRRAGLLPGIIAMLLPLQSGAYFYAYEARPHGIVLGLCGVAIVCWQRMNDDVHAKWWPWAFSLCLFGAFMMHCYALVLVAPFVLTEAFRFIETRRVRPKVWFAIITPAALASLVYLPLLRSFHSGHTGDVLDGFRPDWARVMQFYSSLLTANVLVMFCIIILVLLYPLSTRRSREAIVPVQMPATKGDITLVLWFLTVPCWGALLASVVHGPFFGRYFLSAVIGISVVLAFGAAFRADRRIAAVLLIVLAGSLLFRFSRLLHQHREGWGEALKEPSTEMVLTTTPGQPLFGFPLPEPQVSSMPIAVLDPLSFIYLVHYDPSEKSRFFLVEKGGSSFSNFAKLCPISFNASETLMQFAGAHRNFFVLGDQKRGFPLRRFTQLGYCVSTYREDGDRYLAELHRGCK